MATSTIRDHGVVGDDPGGRPVIDRTIALAEALRAAGVAVSTADVVEAGRAFGELDLLDRPLLRAGLCAVLVKREADLGTFDRAFDRMFAEPSANVDAPRAGPSSSQGPPTGVFDARSLASDIAEAATSGDADAMGELARRAIGLFLGTDGLEHGDRHVVHRVMSALDLADMLGATMRRLRRDGGMSEFELSMRRHEIAMALEAFRRALAAEVARLRDRRVAVWPVRVAVASNVADRPLITLGAGELAEVRRLLQPLGRQLAARVGRRRRPASTGRVDVRRTLRRSMQSGGVPMEPAVRRRHPHRPVVVLLCDVSGSVAEFARFTFTLAHAVHDSYADVHSFAFVGGVAEMTDVFAGASYDVPIRGVMERRGVVGLDGHSDYGAMFRQFVAEHLDVVDRRTTVIVTGDARSNFRDPGVESFRTIRGRARRVYWLNPEPRRDWSVDDSAMDDFAPICDGVFEVSSVRSLADAIAALV